VTIGILGTASAAAAAPTTQGSWVPPDCMSIVGAPINQATPLVVAEVPAQDAGAAVSSCPQMLHSIPTIGIDYFDITSQTWLSTGCRSPAGVGYGGAPTVLSVTCSYMPPSVKLGTLHRAHVTLYVGAGQYSDYYSATWSMSN
jgi:hypothetical protein